MPSRLMPGNLMPVNPIPGNLIPVSRIPGRNGGQKAGSGPTSGLTRHCPATASPESQTNPVPDHRETTGPEVARRPVSQQHRPNPARPR